MRSVIKIILEFLFISIFISLILIQLWSQLVGYGFSVNNWIYWLVLVGLIYLSWIHRWQSLIFLILSLGLSLVGVFFTVLNLSLVSETVFRVSLIFLAVGLGKALSEYRPN